MQVEGFGFRVQGQWRTTPANPPPFPNKEPPCQLYGLRKRPANVAGCLCPGVRFRCEVYHAGEPPALLDDHPHDITSPDEGFRVLGFGHEVRYEVSGIRFRVQGFV